RILYFKHSFPIDPSEYPRILSAHSDKLQERFGTAHVDFLELHSISTAFSHLPKRNQALPPEKRAERKQEKEVQKRRLATLFEHSPEIRDAMISTMAEINGTPRTPESFDQLHDLIKAQAFRLAQWRVAADDINYRRFFDINELAALRMENEE